MERTEKGGVRVQIRVESVMEEGRVELKTVVFRGKPLEGRIVGALRVVVTAGDHASSNEERAVCHTGRRGITACGSQPDAVVVFIHITFLVGARSEHADAGETVCGGVVDAVARTTSGQSEEREKTRKSQRQGFRKVKSTRGCTKSAEGCLRSRERQYERVEDSRRLRTADVDLQRGENGRKERSAIFFLLTSRTRTYHRSVRDPSSTSAERVGDDVQSANLCGEMSSSAPLAREKQIRRTFFSEILYSADHAGSPEASRRALFSALS